LRLFAVEQLRDEMRKLFEDVERSGAFAAASGWLPPVDVCESETAYVIRVELPGIEAEHVSVSVVGSYLKIEGTKTYDEVEGTINRICLERSTGPFCRVVRLSSEVDPDSSIATLRDGVLTVSVAKLLEHRRHEHRIPITTEGQP
jgi:HSP20 family protein